MKSVLVSKIAVFLFILIPYGTRAQNKDYEARVDSLMQLMTLQEKIGQTVMYGGGWDKTGSTINTNYMQYIKEGNVGAMLNVYTAKATRALQKVAVEQTRLGIPLLFGYDVIH
ncbi:MAG TPA: hypothetical protein VJ945_07095, partial [Flavobacteriaceae bacterium]|nr:hypothetical protein [Flavobacteriaceae bacterium]